MCRRPAHARGNGRPIVFALDHVLRAAIVEAEDLVIDIEAIHDKAQAMCQSYAALYVDLEVGIEIVISKRPSDPSVHAVRELIGSDICAVVREAKANRDTAAIVRWTDVPRIRRVAQQPRMIGAAEIRP